MITGGGSEVLASVMRYSLFFRACLLGLAVNAASCRSSAPPTGTVLVYGASSAGIAASMAAARNGATVLLLDAELPIGGMSSQGLGAVDIGDPDTIGGISSEFFGRVGAKYGQPVSYAFEPHVAAEVFREMLAAEGNIKLISGARLGSVTKDSGRIRQLIAEDGRRYEADVFIDATFEGDLMALAGVHYMVGREDNAAYNETLNGFRPPSPYDANRVDPYVVPGLPSSGLLPFVTQTPSPQIGSGDHHVQAYNYRLCLTNDPANRTVIEAPPGYDPTTYELLARWVASRTTPRFRDFVSALPLPNRKFDANAAPFLSTDFVGASDGYPEADERTRAQMRIAHSAYMRGYLYFLRTSPKVPSSLRTEFESYGLCADEFTDSGNWPRQLYVREARRMVGAYVMTENDVVGKTIIDDSIGVGSYALDSHYTQRLVIGGAAQVEGSFFVVIPGPYSISYRSITPPEDEATNLLVPIAMSASHVAYGSMRMEPVYMILGHSAGTAASMAAQEHVAMQRVDYGSLRARLLAEGQKLSWDGVSLTSDIASPQRSGTPVVFTADSGGHAGREYRFLLRDFQNGNVSIVQEYSPSAVWRMPSSMAPGSYIVIANMRAISDPSTEHRGDLPFIVTFPSASAVQLRADKPSPQAVGTPILFTALGVGSNVYQYQFWLRDSTGVPQLVQDYSLASSWLLPTSTPAGVFAVIVHVRTCSCVNYDARAEVSFSLIR
jgi:hypothetical protein